MILTSRVCWFCPTTFSSSSMSMNLICASKNVDSVGLYWKVKITTELCIIVVFCIVNQTPQTDRAKRRREHIWYFLYIAILFKHVVWPEKLFLTSQSQIYLNLLLIHCVELRDGQWPPSNCLEWMFLHFQLHDRWCLKIKTSTFSALSLDLMLLSLIWPSSG